MKLLITWLSNALALMLTAYLVPGLKVEGFPTALVAAIVIGLINTFIRPILVVLTVPLNFLTLGLFTFVINAVVIWLTTLIVPGFSVISFWWAILAAVVLTFLSTVLSSLLKSFK